MTAVRAHQTSVAAKWHDASRKTLLVGILVLSTTGCEYFSIARTYTVDLPVPPAVWRAAFGKMEQHVTWVDAAGELATVRLPCGTRRLTIRTGKQGFCPVTAHALPGPFVRVPNSASALLLPAGGIIPFACDHQGSVTLSFQQGAAAVVLLKLAEGGVPLSGINVSRLLSELPVRTRGDPWLADLAQITAGLGAGEFRADTIKPREPAVFALPEIGVEYPAYLVSADPLAATAEVTSGARSSVKVAAEAPGLTRIYLPDGSLRLDLWLSDDRRYSWLPVSAAYR